MPDLKLRGLVKRYGQTLAVDGVDLDVMDKELVTLLGPSGSGKTTILRMIAGFVEPTAGTIEVGGQYPITTDGGLMSFSHGGATVQMLQRVIRGVLQLRGECASRQVDGAEVALCTGGGAGALFTDVLLLGSARP